MESPSLSKTHLPSCLYVTRKYSSLIGIMSCSLFIHLKHLFLALEIFRLYKQVGLDVLATLISSTQFYVNGLRCKVTNKDCLYSKG